MRPIRPAASQAASRVPTAIAAPLACALIVLALPGIASAARIVKVDFDGRGSGNPVPLTFTGVGPVPGDAGTVWNGILADDSANTDPLTTAGTLDITGSDLLDSFGNATTIDITVNNVRALNQNGSPNPAALNSLFNDFIFFFNGDLDFTISGLPVEAVSLYVFYDSNFPAVDPNLLPVETPAMSAPFGNVRRALYPGVPVVNGQVTGNFNRFFPANSFGAYFGLAIVLPEPASAGLLAAGCVLLLVRRRRTVPFHGASFMSRS